MNDDDEAELQRLGAELEQIGQGADLSEAQRQALKKSAIGVSIAFIHALRDQSSDTSPRLDSRSPRPSDSRH